MSMSMLKHDLFLGTYVTQKYLECATDADPKAAEKVEWKTANFLSHSVRTSQPNVQIEEILKEAPGTSWRIACELVATEFR